MFQVLLFRAKHFIHYLLKSKGAHGLHSPFLFDLYNDVIVPSKKERNIQIEKLRKRLKNDHTLVDAVDIKLGKSEKKTISSIAKSSLSTPQFSSFLKLLCQYLKAENILEAGTSLGINSLYLSSSESVKQVVTIEGSNVIAELATKSFDESNAAKIKLIKGDVYNVFTPAIINHLPDIIFLDADHRGEAIEFYLQNILAYAPDVKCIIVHDIYWSKDMLDKWDEIIINQQFNLTVDLFQAGLIFPNLAMPKQHFQLKF